MFHTVPYTAGAQGSLCERRTPPAYFVSIVTGRSTLGKESLRMGTLPSMTIFVMEIAGVVVWHTVDPEEGRK